MTTRPAQSVFTRITRFVGIENRSLIIALVVLVLAVASRIEFSFTPRNLFNIGQNMAVVGLIAVGMTLMIVSSGMGISVGTIAGCASLV